MAQRVMREVLWEDMEGDPAEVREQALWIFRGRTYLEEEPKMGLVSTRALRQKWDQ